ncbi:hypothetical protein [Mycolicibacterium iranicum]|uniref:Uncharacterized protein n=1 Tax=Mycolicibacterium iranicum TaxID=912594 RepID=A0A178LYW9_MYCIR|nr:hypothetical protein [Mycolicibacterium iranicum]OAN39871.1 hypothetical protein A4X20_16075 [Mycolicibacterium iranicum]
MTVRLQSRTRHFARVLGPFLAIVAIVAVIRMRDMPQLLSEFTASSVWPWVTGAFVLLGGVAIVAFHQIWRGPAAIIVSVLGWLLVVRGIVLLAFPDVLASVADRIIDLEGAWIPILVVMAVIGLYLAFVGWKPRPEDDHDLDVHISVDYPHAA